MQGKLAAEAVLLPWLAAETPLVPAGVTVAREHLSALNDAIQGRLSEIEDGVNSRAGRRPQYDRGAP